MALFKTLDATEGHNIQTIFFDKQEILFEYQVTIPIAVLGLLDIDIFDTVPGNHAPVHS